MKTWLVVAVDVETDALHWQRKYYFLFEFQLKTQTQSECSTIFGLILNVFSAMFGSLFQLRWAHRLHLILFSQQKNSKATEKKERCSN